MSPLDWLWGLALGPLGSHSGIATSLDRAALAWRRHDGAAYAVFAAACTVYAASRFYGYMLVQTGGSWSAPLDDVFIHFDYARSFARGHPFQWSEGNGYSSGSTSLSYPIALAFGYWLGFRGLTLIPWAAVVACVGILGFLLAAGRLVLVSHDAPAPGDDTSERWIRFLVPPAVLSMGALDWTLFSGMENAFHLGVWGVAVMATLWLCRAGDQKSARWRAWIAGGSFALLMATRPESVVCVGAFGGYAAWRLKRQGTLRSWPGMLRVLGSLVIPGAALLVAQAGVNYALTGEWSANGAIAKLLFNDPYMNGLDRWERYKSLLGYIVPRLVHHHFSEHGALGWLVPALAAVPLLSRRRRPVAILVWTQIVLWLLLVSLNNQVRWHNERYAMPAVAWLMALAAVGVGTIMSRARRGMIQSRAAAPIEARVGRALGSLGFPVRIAFALACVAVYGWTQAPRMKDQLWFFGRASRNILDQHVTAGALLAELDAKRVLVGDAGALIYASDRPGLDLIGLGGFHAYPFARSTVHGLGASIELIERIDEHERPDFMAIYPGWWGELPIYFGRRVASVPVYGNVICGGSEKVIYKADWAPLDHEGTPRSLRDDERVVDELDVADLMSEEMHDYVFPRPHMGFVVYRVLGDPDRPNRDLFDAGRIIPTGHRETARVRTPRGGGRLIARVAPEQALVTGVTMSGRRVGALEATPRSRVWQEVSLRFPEDLPGEIDLELHAEGGDAVHYHIWVVEQAP